MSIQARFFVNAVSATTPGSNKPGERTGTVKLQAVGRGPENKTWAAATPSGAIEMTVNNPSAFEWFLGRLGAEVAITIEDRPALCEVCGEEVPPGWDHGERNGVTDYGSDAKLFRHQGCTA